MLSKENIETPYSVPQGYFEEFAGRLLARIKAEQGGNRAEDLSPREELSVLSPLLDGIDKKSPFQAPQGYFDNLTANVLSGARAIDFVNDELENLSPLMTSFRDKTVFRVPEGYFDGLSDTILARVRQSAAKQPAPVVQMGPRHFVATNRRLSIRKWFRYSAAAVTTGLILTMGWLGLHSRTASSISPDLTASLSKVSDQEILNYLENQNIPLAETMSNSTAAAVEFNDADVKNILGNVPDDELNQYLEDNDGKDPVTN